MFYLAALLFPFIAIACGVVSLFSVVRFVGEIYRDIQNHSADTNPDE
jgi:hypothetical protein